ncbi:cysteine desulfurase family protein [Pontiellaceae bacterium B12227]|nr:cysteine desulfurase family protein [Pontiellaceae bacterium B12227]
MYFDYAATTPPNSEVLKTFEKVNREFWANPHALHRAGVRAETLLEQARRQVLTLFGAESAYRCIFTGGATESNNMAIKGVARQYESRGKHLITSAVEHPSVLGVFQWLEKEGWEVTILPVNAAGCVEPHILQDALRPDTMLVSLMHVNNEIGAINNVEALGRMIKTQSPAFFHVDAAQSVGKIDLSLANSPIDLLTFSAHKFCGLKGSGALLLKNKVQLPPLFHGGGQESGYRSGTADVATAAALAKALRIALEGRATAYQRVCSYKQTIAETFSGIDGTELNGALENSSPFVINYSVRGVRPETILHALEEQDMYISTVSACSAAKTPESSVVLALTGNHERAQTSIRISLSSLTAPEEIDALCATLKPTIESLRFKKKVGRKS